MTTPELFALYQGALSSLKELRAKAGLPEPELEDTPTLRADAERFANRLACAPDQATAEIDLLADHAGAQAFWFLVALHWERMELMLLPPAFELLPNPMPYEVLSLCLAAMLATGEAPVEPGKPAREAVAGNFQEKVESEALRLSPMVGDGTAGAVWEFKDIY